MMGRLTQSDLMLRHRTEDITLGQCISACGLDPSKLTAGTPIVDLKKIACFVELHIEQGPTLTSNDKVRVGVVTGIRGNDPPQERGVPRQNGPLGAVNKEFRHDA